MNKTIMTLLMTTALAMPVALSPASAADVNASSSTEAQADTGFFASIGNTVSGWFKNDAQAEEKTSVSGNAGMDAKAGTSAATLTGTSMNSRTAVGADVDADVDADANTRAEAKSEPRSETSTGAGSRTSAESSTSSRIEPSAGADVNADADLGADIDAGGTGVGIDGRTESNTGISIQ